MTRIGYFVENNSLWVLRHRGIVERSLPDVEWVPLAELPGDGPVGTDRLPTSHGDHLFDGGYDFIGTGATPPITAQAKGHDIVYVGVSGPRHENGRIVVRADSPIESVGDLRGKRIGLGHGSWQTSLVILALETAGLTWNDVEPVNTYRDAAERFLAGDFDAWVGSYPHLTNVERDVELRTLIETPKVFSHRSLWFTRRDFADNHPEELRVIIDALQESDRWIASNAAEAAALFPGLDAVTWEHALRTRPWGLNPVGPEFIAEQQHVADLFHAAGLIDRQIVVADAVSDEINAVVVESANTKAAASAA